MAIALGNNNNKTDTGSGDTTSFDSGTGSDRILVVGFSCYDTNASNRQVASVSYGGQSLTKETSAVADNGTSNGRGEVWYLVNPPTGTNDLVVAFAGSNNIINADYFYAIFTGVDQADPIEDAGNDATVSGTQSRITLDTTVDGCMLIDVNNGDASESNYSVGAGQSVIMSRSAATGLGSYKLVGAAGSHNMDINTTASDEFAHAAIALKPSTSRYVSPFPSFRRA